MNRRKMQRILKKVAEKNQVSYETVCREIQLAIAIGKASGHPLWTDAVCRTPETAVATITEHLLCEKKVEMR